MRVNIDQLRTEHRAIVAAIDALNELTTAPLDAALPLIANARLRLAKAVSDNMVSETREIHKPLQTHRLTSRIPAYRAIADRTRELRFVFSAHIARWPTTAIEQDWAGYGRSVRAINADLAAILAWEERDLYPAALTLLLPIEDSVTPA